MCAKTLLPTPQTVVSTFSMRMRTEVENGYKYNKKCQYKGKIQLLGSNVTYKVPHLKLHILEAAWGQVPDNLWVLTYTMHMNQIFRRSLYLRAYAFCITNLITTIFKLIKACAILFLDDDSFVFLPLYSLGIYTFASSFIPCDIITLNIP